MKVSKLLQPVRNSIIIQPDDIYKQVTVRMNYQGVCLRGVKKGSDIKTKRQFLAKTGQFIVSKIDARNGAFGIVPNELEGAVVTADFLTFEVNQNLVDPIYFLLISKSERFIQLMKQASSGTTNRKRLKESKLLSIEINIATPEEQKELVEKYNSIQETEKLLRSQLNILNEITSQMVKI